MEVLPFTYWTVLCCSQLEQAARPPLPAMSSRDQANATQPGCFHRSSVWVCTIGSGHVTSPLLSSRCLGFAPVQKSDAPVPEALLPCCSLHQDLWPTPHFLLRWGVHTAYVAGVRFLLAACCLDQARADCPSISRYQHIEQCLLIDVYHLWPH